MTSASELFYNRRSRFGRSSDPPTVGADFVSQPTIHRTHRSHRHHNNPDGSHARRDRIDPEECDPLRRAHHHPRQSLLHRPSHPHQEHESIQHEYSAHRFSSVNHSGRHVNVSDRLRASANDRLPGAVLLARERLLQRLRGVAPSSTRRSNRNSSGIIVHPNSNSMFDNLRLVDSAHRETETSREWLSTFIPLTNAAGQPKTRRPPGLSQKAISLLCIEKFSIQENSYKEGPSRTIEECSICLENFSNGDEVVRLLCNHRYHFCCLEPWVRISGDCPYCRRGIEVISHHPGKESLTLGF